MINKKKMPLTEAEMREVGAEYHKKLDRTKKVRHDDDCDCVTCQARTEKGGLDYDPSDKSEEMEQHELEVMRDTGIDKEAK